MFLHACKFFEFALKSLLVVICFFCCQRYLKWFLERYQFSQKSGNGTNSRGLLVGWGGHAICAMKIQCLRKSIGNSHLSNIKDNKNDINDKVIKKNDNNNKTNNNKRVGSLV